MEMYASVMPKEYEEPEPDYPLSDSELTSYSSRRSPELRLFESDDLPLHQGDFTSQHAIMVRSRQFSEIAGLMDDTTSSQPTLKRFSRYNQSMHFRAPSQMCELEPGSSQQQQQQQPHTYSKGGGRLKTGFFSGNWTLRGKKEQKMRPSVHNITVVQIGRPSSNSAETPLVAPGSIRSSFPLPPFQHLHQRCHVNNPGPLDYIHSDDTTSLHNHRILSPPGPKNFRSDKFHTDSHKKSLASGAEKTAQVSTALPTFARASDNFTRFRTASSSTAVVPRERIIPIELKAPKDQTINHYFPIRKLPQLGSNDCVDDSTEQRCRSSSTNMRLKKSESCDDVGQSGRNLHSQQLSNNNKLLEYGEILEEDNEGRQTDPVTTAPTVAVGDITDDDVDDDDDDGGVQRNDESRFGLMRRFGGVKSMGPIRRQWHRPVAEVFPSNNIHARSASKDSGLSSTAAPGSAKRNSNSSSSTDERSPTPPVSLSHLLIDADSAYRTGTSESSPSSMSSSNGSQQQSALRKSCPDLRMSGSGNVPPKNMEAYRAQNRNRRAREKKQAALWKKKPIAEWSLDDVLLWLQHCKLDDVASVMIGYDISGADVERWNDETLEQLGVAAEKTRAKILNELKALKERQANPTDNVDDDSVVKTKKGKPRVPLFKLVRSTSYDKVVAVETPLTTRDITVAEGRFGCLQVTKVNGANIPLREQDCFLEINEMPGQAFRSPLMFTKLVSEAAGEPIRLVVLRRRMLPTGSTDVDYDDDNDTSSRGTFLEKTLQAIDQESSASSGVSSSELSSELPPLVDDNKSQVLRL